MEPSRIAQRIVLANRPNGKPQPGDFQMETATLGEPGPGEVLLKTQYLSLDPYMRGRMNAAKSYAPPTPVGGVMEGETISQIVKSNHPDFKPGESVLARAGWTTRSVMKGSLLTKVDSKLAPLTTSLGVRGMPGITAYGGLLQIGKPRPGETVVVAAASGPVGSMVGQLAKIKGARAVGIAGGPEKCAFVTKELGFEVCIDRRAPDFVAQLGNACPRGIDVYFETVGGAIWDAVLPLLNSHARVPVCGLISQYNEKSASQSAVGVPALMRQLLSKTLTIQGFLYMDYLGQRESIYKEIGEWIAEGRIKYREDFVDGLAQAPSAFIGLLEGKNFGKLMVRMLDEQ
jgi:NADPH-dependent curcumin reductase CurA